MLVGLPLPMLPNPDGAIGQTDRQQLAYSYAGIAAAAFVAGNVAYIEFSSKQRSIAFG